MSQQHGVPGSHVAAIPMHEQESILPSGAEDDLDLFRSRLNAAYYPAFVDTVGRKSVLRNGRLNAKALNRMTVGFVRFGHEAIVDPGRIDAYHVNVPLAGSIGSRCGHQAVLARPGLAAVFTPHAPTRLPAVSDDAAQICVKIDASAVIAELEALLARPLSRPLDFDIAFSTVGAGGATWMRALRSLIDTVGATDIPRPVSDYLERAMICQLLLAADHNYREDLDGSSTHALPGAVSRVVALLDESPNMLFTAADLARHAGVGVRRLEQAFREHLGMTPTAFHQQKRYERARADLREPRPDTTVTSVMYRWGFTNHARFAAGYRERFGENPSVTLRNVRGF
ncbi:AraC family transcriptional regulator [Microbacterium sp. BR1]|uniref:AraC family transcriptional regulator n=1 Tax=Microbacterium sp. BR1 TaxID=1070896 RepID=UPI0018E1EC14|nr:AraC family transcriptional regulator [Microbacterium sp. BR1]